tara:strand:- start:8 stop:463 length:456 start_codon:yes stop_codon:yes gene_type:complete
MPGKENKTPNFTGTGWCCRICERDFKTRSNMIDHNHTRLHKLKQATASVGRENELLKSQLGYANKTIKDRRSSWIANTRLLKEKDYWENEYQELRKKVNLGTIEDRDLRIEELIKKNNEQYKQLQIISLERTCANEEIKKLKDRSKALGFC